MLRKKYLNNINFKEGTVIIAGAGPGNLKLVTIKTILALKSADVIIYDSLINKALLKYCKKNVKLILKAIFFHLKTRIYGFWNILQSDN